MTLSHKYLDYTAPATTAIWNKLWEALSSKKNKLEEIGNIENNAQCASEILIVLRLFSWDMSVPWFEDPNIDYIEKIYNKFSRIYGFLSTQSSIGIQALLWNFSLSLDHEKKRFIADTILNLIEQEQKHEAMIVLFDVFWWEYEEINGNKTFAQIIILSSRRSFYIDKQNEFVQEKWIQYTIPTLQFPWIQTIIQENTESLLTWKTKLKKIEKLLKEQFQKLDEHISRIPWIQALWAHIQLIEEVERNRKRFEKIEADWKKSASFLLTDINQQQRDTSKKELQKLMAEKEALNTRIEEIEKEIESQMAKWKPTIWDLHNTIRITLWLKRITDNEDSLLTPVNFNKKFMLVSSLLSSIWDNQKYTWVIKSLSEIMYFYQSRFIKKDEENIVTIQDRERFTPEYITSVFDEVYKIFPQLKITE